VFALQEKEHPRNDSKASVGGTGMEAEQTEEHSRPSHSRSPTKGSPSKGSPYKGDINASKKPLPDFDSPIKKKGFPKY